MSEFFLELFSEEIPPKLQTEAREDILNKIKELFERESIKFDKVSCSFSTPNRLVVFFNSVQREVVKSPKEIKGPNINASQIALAGFLKSNNITIRNLYKRKSEKGEFYFYKTKKKKIETFDLLKNEIPNLLSNVKWKKSMRWGSYDLHWGRPLKSILAIFDGKTIPFKFYHLKSSNSTYTDKDYELKIKSFKSFSSYLSFFKGLGVIINHNTRA